MFQSGKLALKGLIAWFAHRGYHGLAMPSWERKFRVFWGWWNNFWLGRDIVSLAAVQQPRASFEEFAARPEAAGRRSAGRPPWHPASPRRRASRRRPRRRSAEEAKADAEPVAAK